MVMDGVFERHPGLRGISMEHGAFWVPSWLRALDFTAKSLERFAPMKETIPLVVDAMRRDFGRYEGVLYAGLMFTPGGPKVIEFNCRFGDPECQPLMMRLTSDLVEAMAAVAEHKLNQVCLQWDPRHAVCVVMSSGGYPGDYAKGFEITGIEAAEALGDVKVFHAGTALRDGKLVTHGGRVLGVTALGETTAAAQQRAYEAIEKIHFRGAYCRKDIASKAIG